MSNQQDSERTSKKNVAGRVGNIARTLVRRCSTSSTNNMEQDTFERENNDDVYSALPDVSSQYLVHPCHLYAERRRFVCARCPQTFLSREEFEVHKLTVHYKDNSVSPDLPPYGAFSFRIVPPVQSLPPDRFGTYRGIAGENNSCYLDASLMALFYLSGTFDGLLSFGEKSTNGSILQQPSSAETEYARTYLTLHIVNNLRRRGYVPSTLVFEWRRMISLWFGGNDDRSGFDSYCREEEACEFVRFIVTHFGGSETVKDLGFVVKHRREASTNQRTTVKAKDSGLKGHKRATVRTMKHGVEVSLPEDALESEVMLQLFPPSTSSPDNGGTWSTQLLLYDTMAAQRLEFTKLGRSLILQLPRYGKNERLVGSVVPSTNVTCETAGGEIVDYELQSLLVIGRSHFVSYLRTRQADSSPKAQWLYFDSMSDRVRNINIPKLEDVSDQMEVLEEANASVRVEDKLTKPGFDHLRRVTNDLSVAIYCARAQKKQEDAYI